MGKFFRSLIRTSAFLRKEIFEILRQPRLVFSLVLGPFLILLLFGIGYRNVAPSLHTLFVVQEEDQGLAEQIEEYASSLGPQLVFAGVTFDEQAAMRSLRFGDVDLVAVAPPNAYDTIQSNQQAVFTLYHREIDPFQVDYINYFGQTYVDEVNRRVLRAITSEGQSQASDVQNDLSTAKQSATALRLALEQEDDAAASKHRQELNTSLDNVSLVVGASLGVLSGVQQTVRGGENNQAADILAALENAQQNTDQLDQDNSNSQRIERVGQIEENLAELETNLDEFQSINPAVLVSPFRSETKSIAQVQPTATDFFAPAVVALLLQHLAVTFAALSIVRERSVGTMELFRISPLSAMEALLGKYLSYMIFSGLISAVLVLLLVFVLNMPMIGSWIDFSLVVAAIIFTSLSIGFVISLLSETDSQAVQSTMIVLLTSVFFSGFLMALEMFWEPVRIIAWLLPTTYGIILLRDIALRGLPADPVLLAALTAIGVVLFIVAWLMMRRLISKSHK